MRASEPDVVVVGAGIAGVAAATSLRREGVDVLLIEREETPSSRFHGEMIQPYGLSLLLRLGISCLDDATRRITDYRFVDCDADGRRCDGLTVAYPAGTYAVAHRSERLIERLWTHAAAVLGDRFVRGAEIRAADSGSIDVDRPELLIDSAGAPPRRVSPRIVIACDGRNSALRRLVSGRAPVPRCSVAGAPLDLIVGGEISVGAADPRTVHVMRIGSAGTFSVFGLDQTSQRVYWNTPSDKGGPRALRDRFVETFAMLPPPWRFTGLGSLVRAMPAETRWNGPPVRGRCFFAGDAAAVTTPLGGQGMTCALEHVTALLGMSIFTAALTPARLWLLPSRLLDGRKIRLRDGHRRPGSPLTAIAARRGTGVTAVVAERRCVQSVWRGRRSSPSRTAW
ncbi:FAD-dependent oxidoreductase [Sorangium atrum]|uniref:FAD-dependent oxidoreductase n=1 Tax=Sorangium atrum TaxID=2995308 RepID=UPI00358DB359